MREPCFLDVRTCNLPTQRVIDSFLSYIHFVLLHMHYQALLNIRSRDASKDTNHYLRLLPVGLVSTGSNTSSGTFPRRSSQLPPSLTFCAPQGSAVKAGMGALRLRECILGAPDRSPGSLVLDLPPAWRSLLYPR